MTPQQAAKVHELDVHARAEHAAAMEALDPTKDPSMSQTLPILCLKSGAYTIFLSHAAVAAHATLTPFPEPWDNERMTAQFHCLPRVILNPLAIPESEIPWYHLACQAMSAHSSPSA
jgi:hypothetical protein